MALDILIVDDERDIRELVAGVLSDEGYECRTAGDSTAALEAVDEKRPSLVLLDVWLHGSPMDGLEVLDAIKVREPDLPVIIFSGHGNIDTAVSAVSRGAVDFIEKPFDKPQLFAAITEAWRRLDDDDRWRTRREEAQARLKPLTTREKEVLEGLVKGHPNKTIGYDLEISPRTVEIHRANLMSKLDVHSLSDLLRVAFMAGVGETDEIPGKD